MSGSPVFLPTGYEYRNPSEWAIEEARCIVRGLLSGSGVKAFLFGSRARGDAGRFSDIDIAVNAGAKPVSGNLMALLSEAFELSRIPFFVDLVDTYRASPAVKLAIAEEGIQWTE